MDAAIVPSRFAGTAVDADAEQSGMLGDDLPQPSRSTNADLTYRSSGIQQVIAELLLNQALDVFLADTVMPAAAPSTPMGYFTTLNTLVTSASTHDPLPAALEAAALASFAKRFHNPEAELEAMRRYSVCISRLRKSNLDSKSNALSILACIQLLSVYEITNADSNGSFNCMQHLQGMKVLMKKSVERNQLYGPGIATLVCGIEEMPKFDESEQGSSKLSETDAIHSSIPHFDTLCAILPKVNSLFQKSVGMLDPDSLRYESVLAQLRDEAIFLRKDLLRWASQLPRKHHPQPLRHFTQPYIIRFPGSDDLYCPVTRADIYPDYFTGCMWGTYFQCQLHLTNLLDRMQRVLSPNPEAYDSSRKHLKLSSDCLQLVDEVCASVAFMFAGERIRGSKPVDSIWVQNRPPLLVGGLNLQWLLFTVSILDVVPKSMRRNMKTMLFWVGENLGIGQATVLAQMNQNPPGGVTARGDSIKWIGFLV